MSRPIVTSTAVRELERGLRRGARLRRHEARDEGDLAAGYFEVAAGALARALVEMAAARRARRAAR